LRRSRRRFDRRPFEPESLTEDYELGLAIAEGGGNCRFVRARAEDDLLIATRAYFPSALNTIVRQKTRWVHGIALQGWDRTGWGKGTLEAWMRARDRRGPLTAVVLGLGYALVALIIVTGIAAALGWAQPAPMSPLLKALLIANFAMFAWRSAWRFAFTARNYGWYEGLWAVARIPASNVVAIMAGHRAISAYAGTLLGRAIEWDKTSHNNHPSRTGPSLNGLLNPASPLGTEQVGVTRRRIGRVT